MTDLDSRYRSFEPHWRRLEDEATFILDRACRVADIKLHSLNSRTKSLDSIREKALRKNLADPLDTLEDIVGVRVVCLLRSDIDRIGQIIDGQFAVLSKDNKLDGASIDAFGYQSVHFVVTIPGTYAGPRYQDLHGIRFEIQVRTLAMDAWAALSHYLDYKSEPDIPQDLRKDFFALSGLFYVADTHFELFYRERLKSQEAAAQGITDTPLVDRELNLDTLTAYLKHRYPQRRHVDASGVSELVGEFSSAGYTTLEKLSRALDSSAEAFARYEREHPPNAGKSKKFTDAGIVRLSLAIADEAYAAGKYPDDARFEPYRT